MGLKNLAFLFFALCLSHFQLSAQNSIKEAAQDTMSYNEANSKKVIEIGEYIETTIHNNDPESFTSKINKDQFYNRVLQEYPDINRKDPFIIGYLIGISQTLKSFPTEIISEVEQGAYYDFINYRYDITSQTYYALFRLYSSETGLNYHDYRLSNNNGELEISDMYIYLAGEHFASTIGRMMSYSVPEQKLYGKKSKAPNPEAKDLFKAVLQNNNENYAKAYQIMDGMTSELSKEKFLLIFKSIIASQIDEEKYLKSLEDLITTFPDDQTIALNKIDYHIYKEEYFEAIQVINQLQNETEDDFLNFLKANVAFEDKNYDLALNLYEYIIDNYIDFFDGQAGYLSTLVMMKNYPDTVKYLDRLLEEDYDKQSLIEYIEEEDENGENILDQFMASNDYKAWKIKKQ
ncbi:tetratricopeptide repeat protein [Psychroserpens sp. MEBiC05023]